jgi:hypothetical protein
MRGMVSVLVGKCDQGSVPSLMASWLVLELLLISRFSSFR